MSSKALRVLAVAYKQITVSDTLDEHVEEI